MGSRFRDPVRLKRVKTQRNKPNHSGKLQEWYGQNNAAIL
ncbi:hypothetical protein SUBVAR_05556 [Subdoligranulum variabile DSM 15176]|uniref:Uncharacterized protein n=1 Tax=Subdoligranulum variabile DSM 15176 TaxID=411471 RepID=D1PMJ6_9FIRM|nr:hypothetical protein SUBVAR_05556 [Subdoligranulum variabile DSM 15176]